MARTAGRSLELLSLLQAADRWSGPALAARLGVSLRTLGRDVDTLRQLGYPVRASGGRDSTYRLGAGSQLPPLVLDGEQAVAISLALQTSPTSVLGLREAAERALATLARVMPAPLRAQVDATRVTTIRNVWEFSAPPIAPDVLNAVGDAVRRGHVLRHDVLRPDGSRPEPRDPDFLPPLRVEPHHLALWAGRWYLVAFDLDRRAWAIFRVDRMRPLSPTGQPFVRAEPARWGRGPLRADQPGPGRHPRRVAVPRARGAGAARRGRGAVGARRFGDRAGGPRPHAAHRRSLVLGRRRRHPGHLRRRPQRHPAGRAARRLPHPGEPVVHSLI